MYLTALFAPSGLLIARVRFPPSLDILIPVPKVTRIPQPPDLVAHSFVFPLALRCTTAFLSLANPCIRLKIPPAQDTLLPIKQFKLIHHGSLIERLKKRI